MPVTEGQEPEVPNGGQPIVAPSDEDLSAFGTFDPTLFRPQEETEDGPVPRKPSSLYRENGTRLPSFDQRYANGFEGLMFLGALTHSFEWLGHTFVIKTVTGDELLGVAQIIKPWQGTHGEPRAYSTAMASVAIVSIDGQELPIPVSSEGGEYAWIYQRFNYVKAHWFAPTIDKVYSEFRTLEGLAEEVVTAMEKASGPAASTAGSNAASAGPSDRDF